MHRSIGGLSDALQSIADGKASLRDGRKKKKVIPQVDEILEESTQDIESNQRMSDANQHYLDMENCTSRIAAKLREIDNIDLNHHAEPDYGDSLVSNQMKFIDDQCYRAQSLLSGEFYMRNLHSHEVHKNMIELDERINFTAKNWKHSLVEMGIQEAELSDLKAPAEEAAEDFRQVLSDSKKVRRNSVITQDRPSVVAAEADYSTYNAAEFQELNEIIKNFMDKAFLSGTNGVQVSKEVMDRCERFKQKMHSLSNQLIEKERLTIRSTLRDAQRTARIQESEIALLHTQNEEADMVIRGQKESDKQIRGVVEEKFRDPIRKLKDHIQGIDNKLEVQAEATQAIEKRYQEVQLMYQDLNRQRLFADPFLRRRAENLVKGLLRNLNERDLKEQEVREEQMSSSYQQWKKIIEFCTEKERQLGLLETQEQALLEEIDAQKKRIADERVLYRDKAKVLTSKDTEQSNKLLILEEQLSDRARDERRKLHVEHRGVSNGGGDIMKPVSALQQRAKPLKVKVPGEGDLSDSDSVFSGRGSAPASPGRLGLTSPRSNNSPSTVRENGSDSDSESDSCSSGVDSASPSNTPLAAKSKTKLSSRVKQKGLRTVTSLCDEYTEDLLGVTYEHTKRQEISSKVSDHIPRPAPGHITGSEASDNALLSKAQKLLVALRPPIAVNAPKGKLDNDTDALAPKAQDEPWTFGTNSAPRTPKSPGVVKFSGTGRRQSTMSSSKVNYGFWAEPEGGHFVESSSDEDFSGRPRSAKKLKALDVYSLTSTACYVSLYYKYLKKFPNLNFKRDNPRLEVPAFASNAAPHSAERGGLNEGQSEKKISELVKDSGRFQFTVREGVIVVKEALDSLLQCRCIDKIIVTDALEKLSELERRVKLASIPEEEREVRYQLHFLCVSLIHTTMSRAPRVLLVRNNRKNFVEVATTMLALLGVVLNCTLVFWQPSSLNKGSRCFRLGAEGGIVAERVEFICAHLIELVMTLGEVDAGRPLSSGRSSPTARRASAVTSSKTFKAKKTADTPLGPAGFVSLLRIQTSELLRKKHEIKDPPVQSSPTQGSHQRGNKSPHAAHKGVGINYHDLFEIFSKIVDDDIPIDATTGENKSFTMKHRHAILSLQLFLYLALNNKETTMDEAILTLHKGIIDGNNAVRADASGVIPIDVDILLQQMHPGMVPAVLVLELIRRVLEEEFNRVTFLEKIAKVDKDVADLQFLNVQFSGQFDMGLKKGRDDLSANISSNTSYKSQTSSVLSSVTPELSAGLARAAPAPPKHFDSSLLAVDKKNASPRDKSKQVAPLHVSKFKTSRDVHLQWVEDLELHLRRLGENIATLIKPGDSFGVREPKFVPSRTPQAEVGPKTAAIPLPDVLVYKILAHINTLKNIVTSHSINGLARVQALQPAFVHIMRELLAARSRIMAIVTAMTWPMRKKIDWLKLKYNTILEENGAANDQVGDYRALVDRYQRDIDAYRASILLVDREKHSMDYRRTKMLLLDHHDPQIQQLIVEHATEEYATKLTDFKSRETHLTTTIENLSNEYDHLSAQHDTLKAAQRSLSLIDDAQDTAETELLNQPLPRRGIEPEPSTEPKPLTAEEFDNRSAQLTPKVPPPPSEVFNAVDQFMQRERLAEVVPAKALNDGPQQDAVNAQKVMDKAKERDLQRLQKLRSDSGKFSPRLPLMGSSAKMQARPEPPSLPPKLLGFAKRITGGLQVVNAMNTGSTKSSKATNPADGASFYRPEASTDTADSADLDLGSYMSAAADSRPEGVYSAGLDKNREYSDLFGQKTPVSMKERTERGYLRKNSRRRSPKVQKTASQFWNNSGKAVYDHADVLKGPPADSPLLLGTGATSAKMTEEQRRQWEQIMQRQAEEEAAAGRMKKPDLEQKERHIFISGLSRLQPFRYEAIVEHDKKTNSTPLDIRKLIDVLREEQSEEMSTRRALQPYGDLLPKSSGSDRVGTAGGFRPGSGIEFDDDLLEEGEEEGFEEEDDEEVDGHITGGTRSHKASRGRSSRDRDVSGGVSYAEYLVWKAKRKAAHQGVQQLDALKNSLNIQLRSSKRIYAADFAEGDEEDEIPLTEEQFADRLGEAAAQLGEDSASSVRDYSKSNSEVNFILSRSNSRADAVSSTRKFSSKRTRAGSSSLTFKSAEAGSSNDPDDSALLEAARRARGENVPSARASLSLRTRASLIGKLSEALGGMDGAQDLHEEANTPQKTNPGTRSARPSLLRTLTTIDERRRSKVRLSTHLKPAPAPELKLDEARVLAHSIIHGRVLESPNNKSKKVKSFDRTDSKFDMQILDYIANDQLVIQGWEKEVDLLGTTGSESFAGHSFQFDDTDDRLSMSTLREFTDQVAHNVEDSASKVETEYKLAIINLNRLVGKKQTDIAEIDAMTSARETLRAEPSGAASEKTDPTPVHTENNPSTTQAATYAHHASVYTSWPSSHDRIDSPAESPVRPENIPGYERSTSSVGFSRSGSASELVVDEAPPTPVAANRVTFSPIVHSAPTVHSEAMTAAATGEGAPRPPSQPKPSASFSSPHRRSKISESRY